VISGGINTGDIVIPETVLYSGFTYNVTSIGKTAFSGCNNLTSITIPSGVTSIGYQAFSGCTGLIEYLVDSNNSIYSSFEGVLFNKDMDTLIAYPYNKSPKYTIPSSVTSIGEWAFYDCKGLTSITIPSSVTSIGDYAFYGCTGLTTITIPSSVKSIGQEAFHKCSGLSSITIPSSASSIGEWAFASCKGLTSLTIPSSVISIGECAFYGCTGLSEIHCQIVTPLPITSSMLYNVNKSTCKLYVPTGSSGLYRAALVWGDFANIIEENATAVKDVISNDISVYTEQNDIVVKGIDVGETILVYTTSGVLVKAVKTTNDVRIPIGTGQIYLVKAGGKTFKVVTK